jgi:hypothetical protein
MVRTMIESEIPRGGSQLPLSLSRFTEKGREMGDARRLSPREGLYPPRRRVGRRATDSPGEIHTTGRDGGFRHARISVEELTSPAHV